MIKADRPKRFQPRKSVLYIDQSMNYLIKIGGIGVILAVIGIFVFIFFQTLPLFSNAKVEKHSSFKLPSNQEFVSMGVDEWSERPLLINSKGQIYFYDLVHEDGLKEAEINLPEDIQITSYSYNQKNQTIALGASNGTFAIATVDYKPYFENDVRYIRPNISLTSFFNVGVEGHPIKRIVYGDSGERKMAVALQEVDGEVVINAATLSQRRTLFGAGKIKVSDQFDLSSYLSSSLEYINLNDHADALILTDSSGTSQYFYYDDESIELIQEFKAFEDKEDARVSSINFLLGGMSLIFTHPDGDNVMLSLYRKEGQEVRKFWKTKQFDSFDASISSYSYSMRNKAFLLTGDNKASLRYATTETTRWEDELPFNAKVSIISGKYDKILFLGDDQSLHLYSLKDPHPESGFKAFFGKIWYEGYSKPDFIWQSTGGTDEFEPKLSLIPLMIGSLKGTFYALVFALPIAILAALYTSQFANDGFRKIIKPLMEVMASLPSVVLGFLAALWLAPLIENRIPSLIVVLVVVPLGCLALGSLWVRLPREWTLWLKQGNEFILLMPFLLALAAISWNLGPWLERMLFVVQDPNTGERIADFRLWWPAVTGASFEQRNSLIVGFMMGFAVIPIIFTITEDALSNVAPPLKSASLALGASRWQTAMRIIIPSASAGVLSAIMIGFGRAVGETMIVVMATGNTPIMDWNIFNGMRTLSANIAVELPEAPFQGTLYRTLFLGALVLFLMTFCVNTVAEVLRERLRSKYKTV